MIAMFSINHKSKFHQHEISFGSVVDDDDANKILSLERMKLIKMLFISNKLQMMKLC